MCLTQLVRLKYESSLHCLSLFAGKSRAILKDTNLGYFQLNLRIQHVNLTFNNMTFQWGSTFGKPFQTFPGVFENTLLQEANVHANIRNYYQTKYSMRCKTLIFHYVVLLWNMMKVMLHITWTCYSAVRSETWLCKVVSSLLNTVPAGSGNPWLGTDDWCLNKCDTQDMTEGSGIGRHCWDTLLPSPVGRENSIAEYRRTICLRWVVAG